MFKEYKSQSGGARINNFKKMMPVLIMMCQLMQGEGSSYALPAAALMDEESVSIFIFALGFGCLVAFLVLGVPWILSAFTELACEQDLWLGRCYGRGPDDYSTKAANQGRGSSVQPRQEAGRSSDGVEADACGKGCRRP